MHFADVTRVAGRWQGLPRPAARVVMTAARVGTMPRTSPPHDAVLLLPRVRRARASAAGRVCEAPLRSGSVRRVVYTVLMGGYEPLLEQHVAARFDTDLVCFTDDPALASPTWQIRLVEPSLPSDSGRSSRRPKILAHEYLPDYDESIYVDNSVLLT